MPNRLTDVRSAGVSQVQRTETRGTEFGPDRLRLSKLSATEEPGGGMSFSELSTAKMQVDGREGGGSWKYRKFTLTLTPEGRRPVVIESGNQPGVKAVEPQAGVTVTCRPFGKAGNSVSVTWTNAWELPAGRGGNTANSQLRTYGADGKELALKDLIGKENYDALSKTAGFKRLAPGYGVLKGEGGKISIYLKEKNERGPDQFWRIDLPNSKKYVEGVNDRLRQPRADSQPTAPAWGSSGAPSPRRFGSGFDDVAG